jgi:adenosine kinase
LTSCLKKSYTWARMLTSPLIISGSIAIDRIMNFKGRYQDLIHRKKMDALSISVFLDSMEVANGGVGANIAYSLGLLGEKPILLGSAGNDASSYLAELSAAGIDTSYVHISKLATASFNVMTDSEHNQIGGFYPGAMSDAASLTLEKWTNQNSLLCLSAHDPEAMRLQVKQCRDLGIRLLYDPGQQVNNVSGDDLKAGVEAAEVLIINEYEHSLLCDKTGITTKQLSRQVPLLIVTHGAKGSLFDGSSVTKPFTVKAALAPKLVDPTGAGDAYRAGFLYGYLRQWDIETCGRLGAVIASLIIEHYGTRYHFSLDEVHDRYQATFKQAIAL